VARGELVVLAAASLGEPLEQVEAAWEADHPGIRITVATDSSAALRTQIEQGAPADLFLAADTRNPATLAAAGLTDGEPVPFAANTLTVVVAAESGAGVDAPAGLARDGVRIAAAGPGVPLTGYVTEVVAQLAELPGYPDGFAAAYEANVVSREDNARAVVTRVELGEVDAAIAYRTDAIAATGVRVVPIPGDSNVTAAYAGVVVRGSDHGRDAAELLRWMAGPEGGAILADFGFLPAPAG
jgi:molybdate transport system substrate-binding protein